MSRLVTTNKDRETIETRSDDRIVDHDRTVEQVVTGLPDRPAEIRVEREVVEVATPGPQGPPGGAETEGPPGTDGKTVLNGVGSPPVEIGVTGDFYIDTAAWAIYGPKSGGSWGSPTNLIGPPGNDGADGTDGVDYGTGSEGDVLTTISGAATWTAPTGGGGGDTSTPFQPADVDNGWFDASADNDLDFPSGYYKRGDRVFLRGIVQADSTRTSNVMFILDAGCRPASSETFTAGVSYTGSGETVAFVIVQPTGEVMAATPEDPYPDATAVTLSNISFQAAA